MGFFQCFPVTNRRMTSRHESPRFKSFITISKSSKVIFLETSEEITCHMQYDSLTQEVKRFVCFLLLLKFAFHYRLNQLDPLYSKYLCVMVSGQHSQSMTQRGKSRMDRAP